MRALHDRGSGVRSMHDAMNSGSEWRCEPARIWAIEGMTAANSGSGTTCQ